MSTLTPINLLAERNKATPETQSIITKALFANVLNVSSLEAYHEDLYMEFRKPIPDRPNVHTLITMTVYGSMFASFLRPVDQNKYLAMKRHIDNKRVIYGFCNHWRIRGTVSEYEDDIHQFRNPEDYHEYLNQKLDAQVKSVGLMRQLILMRCFAEDDQIKEFDDPNKQGLFKGLLENLDDDAAWLDRKTLDEICCVCEPGKQNCKECVKPDISKYTKMKDVLEKIRKSLTKTTETATSSNILGTTQESDKKLYGMFEKVFEILNDISSGPTCKYNVGYETGYDTDSVKNGLGIYILNEKLEPDSSLKEKTHSYKANLKDNIILLCNHEDHYNYEKLARGLMFNPGLQTPLTAAGLGIKRVEKAKWIKKGTCILIDKQTLNFYEYLFKTGQDTNATNEIYNRWWQIYYTMGIFPFISVVIKQAT